MRKFVVVFLLAAFPLSLFAQPKYEKSFEIGYQLSQSENYKNYYGIDMINGIRINDWLYCGIGLGFGRGTYLAWHTKGVYDDEYKDEYETTSLVPLYGRIKVDLSKKSLTPFFCGEFWLCFRCWVFA